MATWTKTLIADEIIFSINLWYSDGGVFNAVQYQGIDKTASSL
jgi:hypothetical protein